VPIFIASLARAAKSQQEIKLLVEKAFGDKKNFIQPSKFALQSCQRRRITTMLKRTANIVVAIATAV
jgi:hypothetical protein